MTSVSMSGESRVFLFLQGPHGPFFHRLGRMLQAAGCGVWRVGFNAGDRAFWFQPSTYLPFTQPLDEWSDHLNKLIDDKGITDIVLYGDTRPVHAMAVAVAKERGITIHVFEEGYMRPWWVTYERGGSNGNSRLMNMTVSEMANLIRTRMGLSVDLNIAQLADAAAEKLELDLPESISLKDKLDAAVQVLLKSKSRSGYT